MYNRYIPGTNGSYQRYIVPEPSPMVPAQEQEPVPAPQPAVHIAQKQTDAGPAQGGLPDLGDLLLLCILVLMMIDCDESDLLSTLIMAAALFFQL